MATMIDQRPLYKGEAKVWDALSAYLPADVVVYNNREINGREFDYCLFIENVGILIIEVKGWLSDKINVLGVDHIEVEGYENHQRSPKKQARAYRFALLNKISDKYNSSPLVFDMICYPFISKAQYLATHLDIISEEQYTIFKEDLDSQDLLVNKLYKAYDASKEIPHASFSLDLMSKLRQDWEPTFRDANHSEENVVRPYSILSIYPNAISESDIKQIVEDYFSGIKRIVFVGDQDTFTSICCMLNAEYSRHGIQPSFNKLSLGFKNKNNSDLDSFRSFNVEIYYVSNLTNITTTSIEIEEGVCNQTDTKVVEQLSRVTGFNYQQFMVEHANTHNNTLVEAGAGTGKTFSMVSRIAYLCNKKIDAVTNLADELAMVTFTNDAADNMKKRLKQMFVNYFILTGNARYLKYIEDIDRAHISTIHSFAMDILRSEVLYSGLGVNFRIASNEYLRGKIYDSYLSTFLADMEEENPNYINEVPVPIYDLKKKIMMIADRLLAKSVDLKSIKSSEMGVPVDNTIPYFNELIEKVIIPAEEQYAQETHVSNNMDLKECIILLEKVLKQVPEKLNSLKFKYMFVDEFQDTDDVQIQVFQNLQKIANTECKFFVVGDLKQSIYRFRGARLSAFSQMMKGSIWEWDEYHLTRNYRTDHRLLERFNNVFSLMGSKNYLPYRSEVDQLTSSVTTDVDESDLLVEIPCHAKDEEQRYELFLDILLKQRALVKAIMKRREDAHLSPLSKEERTIAVLVRSNWQVDNLVKAGKKKGIKIDTKSGGDLFQLASTIDLYKLVLALNNSSSPVHLINFIESNFTGLKLNYQNYHGMEASACVDDIQRVLDEFFMARMNTSWQQVINEAYTQPILFVIKHIYDALQPWKQYSHNPADQRFYMANYEYLMERIIKYSRIDTLTLNQIVEYLRTNIITGQKQIAREIEVDEMDIQLVCTTIHKSKGLEYGTVILPYTDDDISDLRKVKLDANYSENKLSYTVLFENKIRERNSHYNENVEVDEQIAEESRILYVALTRAIRNCVWINNIDSNATVSWASFMEE